MLVHGCPNSAWHRDRPGCVYNTGDDASQQEILRRTIKRTTSVLGNGYAAKPYWYIGLI
jgi:hypothetical protein